ncbi:MAG TPA: F0F1 ATP synthase subunit A [Pseudonocardiaceae bacterium]|jgi:F-type H+-transporting ATPase subunit a|nr:F0F1 ATP synthase subunit A [Pseudonocardiaceae bacterium]
MTRPFLASININVGDHPQWHILGLTLNSDTVTSTIVASVILIAVGLFVRIRITSGVPNGVQLFFETVTKFLRDQIEATIGVRTAPYLVPFTLILFMFLLICNWLGALPLHIGGTDVLPPPTSDVNLVYPLALLVFVWKHAAGAKRHHGLGRQIVHVVKGHQAALAPMWIIEEISGLMSHALRLFGNLFAGALMIEVIAALLPPYVGWALNGGWKLFDLFIGAVQAFIFALLTIIYFSQATELREEH